MRQLLIILGLPIDELTMRSALLRIEHFINFGRVTGKGHQIATVNADFVVKAMDDPELRGILQNVDMATADGMPLVWGARLLGVPLKGRVTGADMVPRLAQLAAHKGYSIYFLGAEPGVAQRAADVLEHNFPGLKIAGVMSPPRASVLKMDPGIVTKIKAAKPDILLVAFGNPKQEKWIAMHAQKLNVPVMIGVGGTLDFIAGKTRRAPRWMQRSGLEWLYRLFQEPRRMWRRYVVDILRFAPFFFRQWRLMRQGNRPSLVLPKSDLVILEGTAILNVHGRLDRSNITPFRETAAEGLVHAPRLVINLQHADFLDSMALGALVGLQKDARDLGGELVVTAVPPPVMQAMRLLQLDKLFNIQPRVIDLFMPDGKPAPIAGCPREKWAVLPVPDRFDGETAAELTVAGLRSIAKKPTLILDFSRTRFLSSAGLAAMMKLKRAAVEKGGELRLVGCTADINKTLQMANFHKVFPVYQELKEATV